MAKYELTNKAVEDLNKIWLYTFEKWSESQADKYYHTLLEVCQEVANNPSLGKKYDLVLKDLLGIKVNRHIIFYREIHKELVEIVRILHGRMDLKNRINE